jgi:23S rRNA pseudouridine2605 synthase
MHVYPFADAKDAVGPRVRCGGRAGRQFPLSNSQSDSKNTDETTSSSSNGAIPTGAQLAETRQMRWHQQGEALLTLENLRSWINAAGLVLYAPRPQIAAPAPSLVEAVLGRPNPTLTAEEMETVQGLLARLVAEGLAVPLNLLGTVGGAPTDTPDFVASTAVFSYVFTLRGDKAWKQPPETSGALRVSPLSLATHEALSNRGALSVYDLTTELGKEVTEAAVMRALAELWSHLRVLPAPQADGRATLWELASDRFTKQIKAGANAGQPSALSALISLYLGQAVVASEEEIESFLSPLVARSRTRSVIHALLGARQLDSIAIEGRTMLHIAGELPSFLGAAKPDAEIATVEVDAASAPTEPSEEAGDAPRITKFVAKPKKIGTGYLAKATPAKFGTKPPYKPGFGAKSGFGSRAGAAPDRERRPFSKGMPPARGFDKPWEEEKTRRLSAAAKPSDAPADPAGEATAPRPTRTYKPREDSAGRGYERKPSFGSKPAFGTKPSFGSKPAFVRKPAFGGDRPARPSFRPRADAGEGDAPRKTFSKPGTFARKREGAGDRAQGPGSRGREGGGAGTFGRKPSFGEGRPPRRDFAPRPGSGDRLSAGGFREPRQFSSAARGEDGRFAPRKPATGGFGARYGSGSSARSSFGKSDRAEGSRTRPARSGDRPDRSAGTEGAKRVYRKFDAPRDKPARTFRPATDRPAPDRADSDRPARSGGFGAGGGERPARKPFGKSAASSGTGSGFGAKRPSGKPGAGGKKPFGKPGGSFAGKPGSPFAKFADGNKPFGKRPPARKFKPKEDGNA